jgi:cytochrome c oxidase cbb3-type subunit 3
MLTERASLFIVAFTVLNIVACVWLMWWTARARTAQSNGASSAGTNPAGQGGPALQPHLANDKTGHVWDGDLEELNNPLPRWWLGLFVITLIFGAAYLAIYPGLGNFPGAKRWTQIGQYDEQVAEARAKLEQRLAAVKDKPLAILAQDVAAMSTAKNLFGANCSTCHGSDARGARGFPNLTDADWLWGGAEDAVYQTIADGRIGAMPPLGDVLGSKGVNEVAAYVVSLSGKSAPPDWVSAGKTRFDTICAGCHGADGKGNQMLGAPNLTDDSWLHGGDFETVRATIAKGRNNQMPAHLEMLGEAKVRLLAAYVLSLSEADSHSKAAQP